MSNKIEQTTTDEFDNLNDQYTPSIPAEDMYLFSVPDPKILQQSTTYLENTKDSDKHLELEKHLQEQNDFFENFEEITKETPPPAYDFFSGHISPFSLGGKQQANKFGAPFSEAGTTQYDINYDATSDDDNEDESIKEEVEEDEFNLNGTTNAEEDEEEVNEQDVENELTWNTVIPLEKITNLHKQQQDKLQESLSYSQDRRTHKKFAEKKKKTKRNMKDLISNIKKEQKIKEVEPQNQKEDSEGCEVLLKPARKSQRFFVPFFPPKLFCSPYKYDILVRVPLDKFSENDIIFNYYDGETKAKIDKNHKGKDAIQLGKIRTVKDEQKGIMEIYSRVCFTVCSFHHFRRPFIFTCALRQKNGQSEDKVVFKSDEFHTFARKSSQTTLVNDVWASDDEDEKEQEEKKEKKRKRATKKPKKSKKRKIDESKNSLSDNLSLNL